MKLLIDIPDTTYAFVKQLRWVCIGRGNCKTIQQTVINSIKFGVEQPQGEWSITNETDEFYGRVYRCTHCGGEVLACDCRNFCTWCGAAIRGVKK